MPKSKIFVRSSSSFLSPQAIERQDGALLAVCLVVGLWAVALGFVVGGGVGVFVRYTGPLAAECGGSGQRCGLAPAALRYRGERYLARRDGDARRFRQWWILFIFLYSLLILLSSPPNCRVAHTVFLSHPRSLMSHLGPGHPKSYSPPL
jgi:hypothetical protein